MSPCNVSKSVFETWRSARRSRQFPAVLAVLLLAGCATAESADTAKASSKTPDAVAVKMLALAERAIQQKRYNDAKSLIQRMLLNGVRDKRVQVLLGEILLATGAPDAAIRHFDVNADDRTWAARALQGEGLALLTMGEAEEAKIKLEASVKEDPALWRAWNALGCYYDSVGAWKRSSEAYEKAIALNPKSPLPLNNRGYSRFLQQRAKEAIEDLTAAFRLDPQNQIVQANLRLALAWAGQYERAALGSDKKDLARILNNIGFIALLKGDLKTAEAKLLSSVEIDAAYNATARRNLAYLNSLKKVKNNNEKIRRKK